MPLLLSVQVLVANKGIRGKQKLSDKWEPVIYTVVESKPALHIYQIRDQDGNECVVHHNLLLQVNFMPLDATLDDNVAHPAANITDGPSMADVHEPDMSVVDPGAATVVTSLADPLSYISECNENHTMSWVWEQSPSDTDLITDPPHPPEVSSSVLSGLIGKGASPDSSTESQSPPIDPTDPTESDISCRLSSWFGRIIKLVCHLIESMAQVETLLDIEQVQSSVMHMCF